MAAANPYALDTTLRELLRRQRCSFGVGKFTSNWVPLRNWNPPKYSE